MSLNIGFRPVQGLAENILNAPYAEGSIYFTTDTGKIYIDTRDGEGQELNKYPVGGSGAAILYGSAPTLVTDSNDHYLFGREYLDENVVPKPEDLIINNDGIFYKIIYLDEQYAYCNVIAVSGSGGGGAGGGSGTQGGSARLDRISNSSLYVRYENDCPIKFKITALDNEGEPTPNPGTVSVQVNGAIVKKDIKVRQGENEVEVGEYLVLGTNTVRIIASLDVGGSSNVSLSKTWSVTTANLKLSWEVDEAVPFYTNTQVDLNWTVTGLTTYKSKVMIDDQEHLIKVIDSNDSWAIASEDLSKYGLTHGAHKITVWAEAYIEDEEKPIITDKINKTFIFIDNSNPAPIISCPMYDFTLTQYDTTRIPLIIYEPGVGIGETTSIVYLYEDGVEKDAWKENKNLVQAYWNYTSSITGVKYLTIQCGTTELSFSVDIQKLNINNSEVLTNRIFKLKANEISSNEALRTWTEKNGNEVIDLTFSDNFDWINGGLQSENNVPYIGVRAGTTMTINYKPFATDIGNGKAFKIIYKATNCRDYDAKVLDCFDTQSNKGILINAQNALFKSSGKTIDIPLCEDNYIEYEIDITKKSTGDRPENFIVPWINGVPAGVEHYDEENVLQTNAQNIIIGSPDCDVYVYLVKYYNRHLTNEEHLSNFIADASNAKEMLARFERNDILDANGEISYVKLGEKNPDVTVHLYDVSKVPTSKTDVTGVKYLQYKGNKLTLQAENALLRAQGTSSMAYGIAAFNFDLNVAKKKGVTLKDGEGNIIDGWAMDEEAVPVTYFNTKVNVASSEGANNALNQEWYNRFQPYKCLWRHKERTDGKVVRDTMEFKPGIVFIKDNNKITTANGNGDNVFKETTGYLDNPYHKFYAIGCMGNSKKNTEVFHDETNLNECCVEVSDNQLPWQWLTRDDIVFDGEEKFTATVYEAVTFTSEKVYEPNKYYKLATDGQTYDLAAEMTPIDGATYYEQKIHSVHEFRYLPEGEAGQQAVKNWTNFVTWFAKNDVSPYDKTNHPYGYTKEAFENGEKELPQVTIVWQGEYGSTKPEPVTFYPGGKKYTIDDEAYRVHKLLSECQDHLIMDSIIYHYLFIERHTMVDNVAKNTFWSTEDGQHWQLVKDYDNDTADGIDNSGVFSFDYGCEPEDLQSDKKTPVFNAAESVWFKFCHHLYDANASMFTYLENQGAWDSQEYLKAFKEFQGCIPERVWIEDYDRKYFRPYRVYGDEGYFARLAGGLKTLQRTRFEKYQELYMASKYGSPLCANSRIDFRANASSSTTLKLPVKMYADCYIQTAFGAGGVPVKENRVRVKRGELVKLDTGITNATDATCYLFTAQLYQEIGDLTPFQVKNFNGAGATKLRELTLGQIGTVETISYESADPQPTAENFAEGTYFIKTTEDGLDIYVPATEYDENVEVYYIQKTEISTSGENGLLSRVSLTTNTMLEELKAQALIKAETPLNLSNQKNLLTVDADNSAFTTVTFADGATVKKVLLQNPQALYMYNLNKLEDLTIEDYSRLNTLVLNNIDKVLVKDEQEVESNVALNRSKNLVNNASAESLLYKITNVNWKISDSNEINVVKNEDGKVIEAIGVLDKLLKATPYDPNVANTKIEQKDALTGTLDISTSAGITDSEIAFNIYNKYAQENIYPKLDINFEGTAKLYNINVVRDPFNPDNTSEIGENKIVWTRKAYTGLTLTEDFFTAGPDGTLDTSKVKERPNTQKDVYSFVGWYVNGVKQESQDFNTIIKNLEVESEDINIQAVFKTTIRQYDVVFTEVDNQTEFKSIKVDYDKTVGQQSFIPDKIDDLPDERRYGFKGWSLVKNATENEVVNLAELIVKNDITLYPVFIEEDVFETATLDSFFEFYKITSRQVTGEGTISVEGYEINVKPEYWADLNGNSPLKGKITIPAFHENLPVISIHSYDPKYNNSDSGFAKNTAITHIYFQRVNGESQIKEIGQYAFFIASSLRYFDFADSLEVIGTQAFQGSQVIIPENAFNHNIKVISTLAFGAASNHPRFAIQEIIKFSPSLRYLGKQAFAETTMVDDSEGKTIVIGNSTTPSNLTTIGDEGIFTNPPIANITLYSNKSNAEELGAKLATSTKGGSPISVDTRGGNNNA